MDARMLNASWRRVISMKRFLTALIAATTIGATAIATSSNANAWWGWWFPGAVAAGVVTGAIIGSTVAPPPYYYPYSYYPNGPGPYPYYGPRCRPVWNGYNWVPAC